MKKKEFLIINDSHCKISKFNWIKIEKLKTKLFNHVHWNDIKIWFLICLYFVSVNWDCKHIYFDNAKNSKDFFFSNHAHHETNLTINFSFNMKRFSCIELSLKVRNKKKFSYWYEEDCIWKTIWNTKADFLICFLNILIHNLFNSEQAAENQTIQFIKLIFTLFRFKTLRMESDRS